MSKSLRKYVKSCKGLINIEIISDGRLGNQMFEYAFARALQIKLYPDYELNLSYHDFKNRTLKERREGFENTLRFFNVHMSNYDIPFMASTILQNCFVFFLRCYGKILRTFFKSHDEKFLLKLFNITGIYYHIGFCEYTTPYPSMFKNISCRGYFQAHEYFDEIREVLLKEFTPKFNALSHNKNFLAEIENSESVCVTIRRGDYLLQKDFRKFNVCNPDYFIEAMNDIKKQIPDCKFFVFSDDVEDVKNNFDFPYPVIYETGNDPVWEKLRLMYSCKHFIISNSTFSWWAQYLSRNENKIVYAPSPWFRENNNTRDASGLYMPYMKIIKCHE